MIIIIPTQLVGKRLEDALKTRRVGSGLAGVEEPAYIAMGNMTFNFVKESQESFSSNADIIMADLPNLTYIQLQIKI